MAPVPSERPLALAVLDQSPVPDGTSPADALQATVDLARTTESLGYRRYWLAEHHNTRSLAGTAPEVLAAAVASATNTIRVGSGGVLLPYYSPLKVAEAFRTLHALFPGRIDLGVGRAAGTDAATEAALLASGGASGDERFAEHLAELCALVSGDMSDDERTAGVRAMPGGAGAPVVWLLGSSSYSSACAAHLGLPLAFAHFITPTFGPQIVGSYRAAFRPGLVPAPAVLVAVAALCADTDAEARRQASTAELWQLGPEGSERLPILPPDAVAAHPWTELERARAAQRRAKVFVGAADHVRADLLAVAADFDVDELLVVTVCHDLDARRRSYELLAEAFDLRDGLPG